MCSCDFSSQKVYEEKHESNIVYHKDNDVEFINDFSNDFPDWNNSEMLSDLLLKDINDKLINDKIFFKNFVKHSEIIYPWYDNISNYRRVYLMSYIIELDKPLVDKSKIIEFTYELTIKISKNAKIEDIIIPENFIINKTNIRYNYKQKYFIGSYEVKEC